MKRALALAAVSIALALSSLERAAAQDADASGIARKLIDVGGSADESDAKLLAAELVKLPRRLLDRLGQEEIRFLVCRNSVADGVPLWKNVHVRGWPRDFNYDRVPGRGLASLKLVVIAIVGHDTPKGAHVPERNEGHGSWNLVWHEMAHAMDGTVDLLGSVRPIFNDARDADLETLSAYESQRGTGGIEETYAESFARSTGGDPTDAEKHPHLHAFWASDPIHLQPAKQERRERERDRQPRREARSTEGDDDLRSIWRDIARALRAIRPRERRDEDDHNQWY